MRAKESLISICVALALAAASFGGRYWERYSLLTRGPLLLKHAVTASVAGGEQGLIPKGATFYPFLNMGETSEYVVFVEMKEREVLAPAPHEWRAPLSPLHAYLQSRR